MPTIALIGIGNILFSDEGVGCFASSFIDANYTFNSAVDIIDGGTLGYRLMDYYTQYDEVIIIDTISANAACGTIYSVPADELLGLGNYKQTAHEVEVVQMLEICSILGSVANVTVVGIVPQNIECTFIGLTPQVDKNFDKLIDTVLKKLENLGVHATPKKQTTPRKTIIESYAHR